ncbi:MAG: hypothetical protein ISS72_04285 [Candidatus Brocadiae bacterium]|nr:hypothetical protein [Candidatus Brocadiia bacterium]
MSATATRASIGPRQPLFHFPTFLMALAALAGHGATVRAACTVLAAQYSIRTSRDPGRATVLIRNGGKEPVHVVRLLLDGTLLPAFGIDEGSPTPKAPADPAKAMAAARVTWARLDPHPIAPGRSACLRIQFRARPAYPFRLDLLGHGTLAARCKVFPVPHPLRITNIACDEGLTVICIHVENASSQPEKLKALELNDKDVTARTWRSAAVLAAHAKELFVLRAPGLRAGDAAAVRVIFDSGRSAVGAVRLLPVFPIVSERGDVCPDLGILETQANWPPSASAEAPAIPRSASAVRIFSCPSHARGDDWGAVAGESLRRGAVMARRAPRVPAYLAVCRSRSDLACPVFAGLADAAFLNPCLPQYSRRGPADPLDAVTRGMALLRDANAPAPCFALVAAHAFGDAKHPLSAAELRRLTYATLACGARGLIYRVAPSRLTPRTTDALRQINEKVRPLRPLFLLAEPMDWASSTNRQVLPRVLLAGRDGLLLFLLNAGDGKGRLTAAGPAQVSVRIPPWLASLRLSPESDRFDGTATVEERRILVKVNRFITAALLVFRVEGARGSGPPGSLPRPEGREAGP